MLWRSWGPWGAAAKLESPGSHGKAGPQGATAKVARKGTFFPRMAAVVSPTASLPGAGEYLQSPYSGCDLPSHAAVALGQHVPPQLKATAPRVELPSQLHGSTGAAMGQDLRPNVPVPALGPRL